jgi:ABC-type lipopolysaccharide export system ATPase subunit
MHCFSITYGSILSQIRSVLEELDLQHCADTRIGDEIRRGISGGEKKRLSVGLDLLLRPSVLFLDEPVREREISLGHISYDIVLRQLVWMQPQHLTSFRRSRI